MLKFRDRKLAKQYYEETKSCGATAIRFQTTPSELREIFPEISKPKYKIKWDSKHKINFDSFTPENFRYKDLDRFTHISDEEKNTIIKMWEEMDL